MTSKEFNMISEECEIEFGGDESSFDRDGADEDAEDHQLEIHRNFELANEMMNAFDDLESDDEEDGKTATHTHSSHNGSYQVPAYSVENSTDLSKGVEAPIHRRSSEAIHVTPLAVGLHRQSFEDANPILQERRYQQDGRLGQDSHFAYPSTSMVEEKQRTDSLDEKYLKSSFGSKEDLQILYDARGREIARLTDALSTLQETSERHVRALKHQLEILKADKDELKVKLKASKTAIVAKSDHEARLQNQLDRINTNFKASEEQNQRLMTENREAAVLLKTLEQELVKLQNSSDLSAAQRSSEETLQSVRQRAEADIKRLVDERNDLKTRLEETGERCSVLEKEIDQVRSAHSHLLREHEGRVADLTKLLAHERQSSLQTKAEHANLVDKLEDDKRRLFEELEKLEEEKRSLEHGCEANRRQSRDSRNSSLMDLGLATPIRLKSDSEDLDPAHLKDTLKQSVFVSKQLRMKVEKLENEVRAKEQEVTGFRLSNENTEKAKMEAEEKIENLNREIGQLKQQVKSASASVNEKSIAEELNKSLQSQLDSVRGRLVTLESENASLKEQLKETTKMLADRKWMDNSQLLKDELEELKLKFVEAKDDRRALEERFRKASSGLEEEKAGLMKKLRAEESHSSRLESELSRQLELLQSQHAATLETLKGSYDSDRSRLEEQIVSLKTRLESEVSVAVQDAVARARLEWMKKETELPREQFERSISDLDELKATTDALRRDRDKYLEEIEKIRSRMYEDRRLIRERWKEEREKLLKKYGQLLSDQEQRIRAEMLKESDRIIRERIEQERSGLRQQSASELSAFRQKESKYQTESLELREKAQLLENQLLDKQEAVERLGAKLEECRKDWEKEKEALLANCKTSIPDLIRKMSEENPTLVPHEKYANPAEDVRRLREEVTKRDEQLSDLRNSVENLLEKFRSEVDDLRRALEREKRYGKEQREKYVELKKKSLKYQDYVLSKVNKLREDIKKVDSASKEFMKSLLGKISQELTTNEATSHLFPSPSVYTRETVKVTPQVNSQRIVSDNVFESPTAQNVESFRDSVAVLQSQLREVRQGLGSGKK